jgi:hypothetical protein
MCLRRDDEMSFQRGQGGREKASAPVPSLNSDLHCLPDESWLALPRLRCREETARGEVGVSERRECRRWEERTHAQSDSRDLLCETRCDFEGAREGHDWRRKERGDGEGTEVEVDFLRRRAVQLWVTIRAMRKGRAERKDSPSVRKNRFSPFASHRFLLFSSFDKAAPISLREDEGYEKHTYRPSAVMCSYRASKRPTQAVHPPSTGITAPCSAPASAPHRRENREREHAPLRNSPHCSTETQPPSPPPPPAPIVPSELVATRLRRPLRYPRRVCPLAECR